MPNLMLLLWFAACLAFAATACQTPDPMCERLRAGMDVIERGRRLHQIPEDEADSQRMVQLSALQEHGCVPSDGIDKHESPAEDHMTD